VVLIFYEYGDGQNSADGAGLGVSEARVETVDCDVRFVCWNARVAKSRLGCGVIAVRDFATGQILTNKSERGIQLKRTTSPSKAFTR
jgi:hypothetical protein